MVKFIVEKECLVVIMEYFIIQEPQTLKDKQLIQYLEWLTGEVATA